jgi:acetoin utilization deacetylase AcuC-like enzyme
MVGALHALERPGVERVAIVDFDVHHGNGTEEICRRFHAALPAHVKSRILFISTHIHDTASDVYSFYPGSGETSDMVGNIMNIPLRPLWRRKGLNHTTQTPPVNKSWVRFRCVHAHACMVRPS